MIVQTTHLYPKWNESCLSWGELSFPLIVEIGCHRYAFGSWLFRLSWFLTLGMITNYFLWDFKNLFTIGLRAFECCLVVETTGKGCSGQKELLSRGSSDKLFPSVVSNIGWQNSEGSKGWLSTIHILPRHILARNIGGLSQPFPFHAPGELIQEAKPLYCTKQWSPILFIQGRYAGGGFIMHRLLQLDFSS